MSERSNDTAEKQSVEWLDIVDEEGNPTGQVIDRRLAHAQGIRPVSYTHLTLPTILLV